MPIKNPFADDTTRDAGRVTGDVRITNLDQISDSNISESSELALETPNQTFKMTVQQLADYNSATQAEVNAGTIPDKYVTPATLAQYFEDMFNSKINALHPVGSQIIGGSNPSVRGFVGTWQALESDITIGTVADGDLSIGTITGENEPIVPVPLHSHEAGTLSTDSQGNHTHTISAGQSQSGGTGSCDARSPTNEDGPLTTSTSGAHTHGISGYTEAVGTYGAVINVRGRRFNAVIWLRIS